MVNLEVWLSILWRGIAAASLMNMPERFLQASDVACASNVVVCGALVAPAAIAGAAARHELSRSEIPFPGAGRFIDLAQQVPGVIRWTSI